MTDIWFVGNTGVRNPLRIQDGLRVYADSSLIGRIRGVEGAVALMRLLCERGVLNNGAGKDASGSYGRKWRLVFNLNGFTYPCVEKKDGFLQEELGPADVLTPFGEAFLRADTVPAVQECFLRAMSMPMKPLQDGGCFSPLCWTLKVLLEIEKRTGSASVSFLEFAVCIQTTAPDWEMDRVAERILDIRRRRADSSAKKKFDRQIYEEAGKDYPKKNDNFKEYADMNLRYLRATGILQQKGRGICIVPEKHALAERLAAGAVSREPLLDRLRKLCSTPPLPTDDAKVARAVLEDLLGQLKQRHIAYDLAGFDLTKAAGINMARHSLEEGLSRYKEELYAAGQPEKWEEISDYMELIGKRGGKKRYDDDNEIYVPKEEAAAYLEWCIWRAFLAIGSLTNKPYEVRRFRIDQDFLPVSTAPGNGPDLIAEFTEYVIVIEVTLSEGSRQEAMEGEPVRRHVADLAEKYEKPVYGLFIANHIDSNTAETFRTGVWYTKEDRKLTLQIVPFTLEQFRRFFRTIFASDRASSEELVRLMENCAKDKASLGAPEWKKRIGACVAGMEKGERFRRG